MYYIKYKGKFVEPRIWMSLKDYRKSDKLTTAFVEKFSHRSLITALRHLRQMTSLPHPGRDIYNLTLEDSDKNVLAKVVKYDDPEDWEVFRVRVSGSPRQVKRVYDIVKKLGGF
jgi:hypothetical protein